MAEALSVKKKKNQNQLSKTEETIALLTFIAPVLGVVMLIIVVPVVFGMLLSIYNIKLNNMINLRDIGINIFKLPFVLKDQFYGLQNYIEIFTDKGFWLVLGRTVVWTFGNVFFHVSVGVWLATLLNRRFPGRSLYRVILILPWAVPVTVATVSWKIMYNFEYGTINNFLGLFGISGPNWLADSFWTFIGACITNIWLGIPFMMLIALGGLQSLPLDIYEAADIDGATPWQKFLNITIPLLKPIMVPSTVLGTVWTFNKIEIIYLLKENKPTDAENILITKMYRDGFDLYRYGYAAALAVVIFIILITFSVWYLHITGVPGKEDR